MPGLPNRILLVEDKAKLRKDVRDEIKKKWADCEVSEAKNENEAEAYIARALYPVVVTDVGLDLAGGTAEGGYKVFEAAKRRSPETQVIIVTSHPDPIGVKFVRNLRGLRYIDRTSKHYKELLIQAIWDAHTLFRAERKRHQCAFVLTFPDGPGSPVEFQVLPRDQVPRQTNHPLKLDVDLLKEAAAGIGSLTYIGKMRQLNALSQFVGQYASSRVFDDNPELLFRLGEAIGQADDRQHLPIRLVSNRDGLELPLELLHNEEGYIALQHPLVRVLRGVRSRAPGVSKLLGELRGEYGGPLRVLLLAADTCSPDLCSVPMVDDEIDAIKKVIDKCAPLPFGPEIECEAVHSWEATLDIARAKFRERWHIIHYAGHGLYDEDNPMNSRLLFWERGCEESEWADTRDYSRTLALRGRLRGFDAADLSTRLQDAPPSLVYLNCCHSARTADAHSFTYSKSLGLIDAVAAAGVPAVAGHRWPVVDDQGAIELVQEFYKHLLCEYSTEEAMFRARKKKMAQDPTWASPVLVVQAE